MPRYSLCIGSRSGETLTDEERVQYEKRLKEWSEIIARDKYLNNFPIDFKNNLSLGDAQQLELFVKALAFKNEWKNKISSLNQTNWRRINKKFKKKLINFSMHLDTNDNFLNSAIMYEIGRFLALSQV